MVKKQQLKSKPVCKVTFYSPAQIEAETVHLVGDFSGPLDSSRAVMRHICLEVDDIDSAIAQIRQRGWPIGEKKLGGDNAWQAWMNDPTGIPIEIMQYTPQSSHFTGVPCPVTW